MGSKTRQRNCDIIGMFWVRGWLFLSGIGVGLAVLPVVASAGAPPRAPHQDSFFHSTPAHSKGGRLEQGVPSMPAAAERPLWPGGRLRHVCSADLSVSTAEMPVPQEQILLAPEAATETLSEQPEYSWTTGLKKVLVMRVNFPDDPTDPIAPEAVATLMAEVKGFYMENSYHQLFLEPVITPLLTLPRTVGEYAADPRRHNALREDALAAAQAAGFPAEDHDLDIVMNRHLFGLRANVSARGCWLQVPTTDAAVHELGHNLGLGHANLWVGRGDTVIGSGRMLPYGNMFDAMADLLPGAWPERHFNAAHKRLLGWLPPAHLLTITNSGVYRLSALDTSTLDPGAVYALTIRKDSEKEYWMECRQKAVDNPWSQNGLLLYFGPWSQSFGTSPLLDLTPNSHWADDSEDAPLLLGRTFSDPEAGIHITPLSRSQTAPGWMDVQVVLGQFPDNQAPVLTLQPEAEGSVVDTLPGVPVQWQATATDPEDDRVTFSWEFGDGTLAGNSNQVEKSWATPGEYLLRCWVSDGKGGTAFAWRIVRVGQPATWRVSGRVTCQGQALAGVRISLTDSLVTYTDADGYFTAVGLTNRPYQIHPGKAYYSFLPQSRFLTLTNGHATGQDFEAAPTDTPNNPPYVMTWNPGPEAVYDLPANVPLTAWAYDDGEVQAVQFVADTGLATLGIGNSFVEVWTNLWVDAPPGEHLIIVQAMDDFGAIGQATPTRIVVREPPTVLESIRPAPAGGIILSLRGPAEKNLLIEASTNLVDWTAVATCANPTGHVQWTDPNAAQFPHRFYRTRPW